MIEREDIIKREMKEGGGVDLHKSSKVLYIKKLNKT